MRSRTFHHVSKVWLPPEMRRWHICWHWKGHWRAAGNRVWNKISQLPLINDRIDCDYFRESPTQASIGVSLMDELPCRQEASGQIRTTSFVIGWSHSLTYLWNVTIGRSCTPKSKLVSGSSPWMWNFSDTSHMPLEEDTCLGELWLTSLQLILIR